MANPTLWHIRISHYSEKVRWALDHKGVEHARKSPPPPAHMAVALAKTRGAGKTFPLLDLDGRTYADSSEIIAALEDRYPDPPLYPSDPEERSRALELEDFFDEQVGPHSRLLAWHEAIRDRPTVERLVESQLGPARAATPLAVPMISGFAHLRFGVKDERAAEEARSKLTEGFDRIEAELGEGQYLVGDFSVADLTAASLYYPIVLPPEAPEMPEPRPAALVDFQDTLRDRRAWRWVEEMFSRHRNRGGAKRRAATAAAA